MTNLLLHQGNVRQDKDGMVLPEEDVLQYDDLCHQGLPSTGWLADQ